MTIISLIAAIDESGGLGFNNQLLCHLPADLQYFKNTTMGKPIIMGRKTFDSIGKALPGRKNIVLSRNTINVNDVLHFDTISKALIACKSDKEVFIIGGAQLYNQSIELANRLYLTRIHHQFTADVFFPPINSKHWHCVSSIDRTCDEKNKFDMTFTVYEQIETSE